MSEDSLKYKFLDLVFTFWLRHKGVIRFLSIFGLLMLIDGWQKTLLAIPLIVAIGVGGFLESVDD